MLLKSIVGELFKYNRTLSSDGTEAALRYVMSLMPEAYMEYYPAGSKAWTWTVPPRWNIKTSYFASVFPKSKKHYLSYYYRNPLGMMAYSKLIDKIVNFEELTNHLYYSNEQPQALPWRYSYYRDDWAFCISKELFDMLPRDGLYHVFIDSEFVMDPMPVLTCKIGDSDKEIMLLAHIDHPAQANDDASGVATIIEVAQRLREHPLPTGAKTIRILIMPETIGSIAFLANHEDLIPKIDCGIFVEMTGNDAALRWHETKNCRHRIDQISKSMTGEWGRPFGTEPANDERVLESVDIPCISVNRGLYPEYHTSADNLDIICEDKLQEAADIIEKIIRIAATNYVPKKTHKGPIFLSGYGLFDRTAQKIDMQINGETSVFDIAYDLELDYWAVYDWCERFKEKGLVRRVD